MIPATCDNPVLGERLLERARGGRSALPRELAAHLAECVECAVTLERGRRMATAMRELKPTRAEIAAARVRYVARRGGSRGRRLAPLALAFGSLLFTALAFAGAVRFAVVHGVLGGPTSKEATVPGAIATSRGPTNHAVAQPAATSVEAEIAAPAPADTTATPEAPTPPPPNAPPATPPIAPATPGTTATPSTPPGSIATPTPSVPAAQASSSPRYPSTSSGSSSVPSTASLPSPSPWILAADAMRARDYPTAERAFAELATSSDPKTRDEARLAHAQVWLAEGRAGVARPELTELASHGATSLVRERASEALRALGGPASP